LRNQKESKKKTLSKKKTFANNLVALRK